MIKYGKLPEHMRGAARRYVEEGIKPGGFLTAVLCNDLMEAYACADDINTASIRTWVLWLYNDAPSLCYGSIDVVDAWCAGGGVRGKSPKEAQRRA